MRVRLVAPGRGLATAILGLVCAVSLPALAQPRGKADKSSSARSDAPAPAARDKADKKPKEKPSTLNTRHLNGRLRTPQLLYSPERAKEGLERASLEKRSFI